MKARMVILSLALGLVGVAVCFAQEAHMGSWKLNEAKSKLAAGGTKGDMVMYQAAGDNVKISVDGSDAEGKPMHTEWTGKFDGKEYPVTGDPMSDMRSYKKADDHTLEMTNKKDGKVTTKGRIVVAADGKSRTVTISGKDPKGNKISSSAVYDKQ